jgi:transposase
MTNQFFLGIDVGKYHHQASLIDSRGIMVSESIKFNNSLLDYEFVFGEIKKQLPVKAIVTVGMESTGHYYWHLKDYFLAKGVTVKVFNPIETQLKSKTKIRKVKNDRIDSLLIAELTREKQVKPYSEFSPQIKELKSLTRFQTKLKAQQRYYKQEIGVLLERLNPEFYANFSNIFLKTPLMVIREYFVNGLDKDKLIVKIIKTSRGRVKQEKAQRIISDLDNSLGLSYRNSHTQLQFKLLLQNLELIDSQLKEIENEISKYSAKYFKSEIELISSIRGVSVKMASVVLSELGNINRFKNKDSLTAFAGLDASVKQSGRYLRQSGNNISKRGSKHLRRQLYYAAKTSIIFDPELKGYYLKKKAQGKHYNVIMVAIARKILMRIYAVLKQKRPYEIKSA